MLTSWCRDKLSVCGDISLAMLQLVMELLVLATLLVLAHSTEVPASQDVPPVSSPTKLVEEFESPALPFAYHTAVGVPAATTIKKAEQKPGTRIVGGSPALSAAQYPYFGGVIITLESAATSVCGASLVSPRRLLTAAHCWWDGRDYAYTMQVVVGSARLFSGGVRVSVVYVAAHAHYVPGDVTNDLAVLAVPPLALTNDIKVISLPVSTSSKYEGLAATVIGYGRYTDSSPSISHQLRGVLVSVMSNAQCSAVYGAGVVTPAVLCTGGGGVCGGDSGGPLVYTNKAGKSVLIGVTNFVPSSSGCASGLPAGYVRLTHHTRWIRAQL